MDLDMPHDHLLAADWAWVHAKLQTAEAELAKLRVENARLREALDVARLGLQTRYLGLDEDRRKLLDEMRAALKGTP